MIQRLIWHVKKSFLYQELVGVHELKEAIRNSQNKVPQSLINFENYQRFGLYWWIMKKAPRSLLERTELLGNCRCRMWLWGGKITRGQENSDQPGSWLLGQSHSRLSFLTCLDSSLTLVGSPSLGSRREGHLDQPISFPQTILDHPNPSSGYDSTLNIYFLSSFY